MKIINEIIKTMPWKAKIISILENSEFGNHVLNVDVLFTDGKNQITEAFQASSLSELKEKIRNKAITLGDLDELRTFLRKGDFDFNNDVQPE